jgi:hypothetical protein
MKLHPTISDALTVPPVRIMLLIVVLAMVAALGGCASLTEAGHTSYTVRAAPAAEGKTVCYDFESKDGKEYAGRVIQFQGTCGIGAVLTIQEGPSKAFRGQGIAAKALSVLPVTGLDELLGK